MDIDMPEMNGLEAARIIQKTYPTVKVIVLSMHDEKAMIQALIGAGVDGYLLKNTPKAELVKAIYEVANGSSYFPVEVKSRLLEKDSDSFRKGKLAELTDRELEILTCIAEGLSNKEIGEKLFISHRTVDTHRTNLMQKLDVHNVAGLVRLAIQCGLVNDWLWVYNHYPNLRKVQSKNTKSVDDIGGVSNGFGNGLWKKIAATLSLLHVVIKIFVDVV